MTIPLSGEELGRHVKEKLSGAVVEEQAEAVVVESGSLLDVMRLLKDGLDLDYLIAVTAVDYLDYFEVIYQLASIERNHGALVKARCYGRDNPVVPSVVSLWQGADLQEREVYDLMGVGFAGHPNLKRVLTWEGFSGHPLRKDYLHGPQD